MKTIYRLCIIGMICLLSNTTYAQIYQHYENGKSGIDGDGTSRERVCFCLGAVQLGFFNNAYSQATLDLEIDQRQWLFGQELLLADQITGGNYFYQATESPYGLPADYNFKLILSNYIKNVETREHAKTYDPKLNTEFLRISNYNRNIADGTGYGLKVFQIRLEEGVIPNSSYGDLSLGGLPLKDMSNELIGYHINEYAKLRQQQERGFKKYHQLKDKLKIAKENGFITNYLTNHYIHHYNNQNVEDAVRFVTRYMASINEGQRHILQRPFGSSQNIFDVQSIDFTREIAAGLDLNITSTASIGPLPTFSADEALYGFAHTTELNNVSRGVVVLGSDIHYAVKEYFQNNRYRRIGFRTINRIAADFANNKPFTAIEGSFASTRNNARFQSNTNKELGLSWMADGSNGHFFKGLGNVLKQFYGDNPDYFNIEGNLFRSMFKDNGVIIPTSSISDYTLGQLFNFRDTPWQPKPSLLDPYLHSHRVEFDFVDGIGSILWDNGVHLFDMLDRPYVLEGITALLNGESFDFAFRGMVYDLKTNLQLTDAQEDYLISNRNIAQQLNTFIRSNSVNNQIPVNVSTLSNELVRFGLQNKNIDLAQQMVNEMLSSVINNQEFNYGHYFDPNAIPVSVGPLEGPCPFPPCGITPNADELWTNGPGLVRGLMTGSLNVLSAFYEYSVQDYKEGIFISALMKNKYQIDFPEDIDYEALGEMYKIRFDDLEIVVELETGIAGDAIQLGFAALDILTIISPSRGGGAFLAVNGGGRITAAAFRAHLQKLKQIAETTLAGGRGYKSFEALKRAEGNASSGNALHHIVEQNGFKKLNQQKFGKTNIHNTKNILDIPTGPGTLHNEVTKHYGRIHPFTEGKRFREWIKDLSFEEQYKKGIEVLELYGWDGVSGIID